MSQTIPKKDADFHVWQSVFVQSVTANATRWNIPASSIVSLTASQTEWNEIYEITKNKGNRTAADVQTKKTVRESYEKNIRNFKREFVASNSLVTDTDRVAMNITVPSLVRIPTPVPSTKPTATINFSTSLQHTLVFFDSESAHSNAKPEGVHGCEVFMKIDGDAPLTAADVVYVGTCTSSPYTVMHDKSAIGKKVWYLLRWINTRGETGPWSVAICAMVVG